MVILKKKRIQNKISVPMICLGMFLSSMFCNPDPYLGIADHYIFLLAYVALYFVFTKRVQFYRDTTIYLFMLGWIMLSCVVSVVTGEISSGYVLSYVFYVLILLLTNGTKYSEKEIVFFSNSYIFSAVIICILVVVFRYDFYGSGGERITIKILDNPAIDPNYLGAYLVVPFLICYGKLLKKVKWMNCIVAFLLVIGIFSTASRGAMVATFVGAFVTTFLYFRKSMKTKKILIIALVILIGGIVILNYAPSNSLLRLFDFSSYKDASNAKRFSNWLAGLEAFYQRPLLGYGPRDEMGIIREVTGTNRIAHNTYIAALMQFGLLGVSLFGIYICYLFRKNKNNSTMIGCIVATLIVCVFISAQVAVFLWIPLIFAAIVGNYKEDH